MIGTDPTFEADPNWRRWTEDEAPDFAEINAKWEGRASSWYSPIDWLNYGDAELGTTSEVYTFGFTYWLMIYYAVLNTGANEFGPVSVVDFVFVFMTLLISTMLVVLVFGDIVNQIGVLSQSDVSKQEMLDQSNEVMMAIEL
jgi:hypothetical protein